MTDKPIRPIAYQLTGIRNPPETWVLCLNRYQRDNLLWLLNAIGYPYGTTKVEPFTLANTGDWVGELTQMLMKVEGLNKSLTIDPNDHPNMSLEELRRQIDRWVRAQHPKETGDNG
jgi:hypothetical protein